ncbi:MAG: aminotransferase class I/II-fold pyridoxal phosphate-dependent enzyme [Bacteroidia bacterium]|nr:aminotransferase class I/II-fold pyridoxal phosphate-dependent enzyme [Bacteroidia bacterium]
MKIADFKLERYFAKYEFSAKYLLSSSDCDGFGMAEILDQANGEEKALWDDLKLGYTESEGHPLLKECIASLYQNIRPEQVLVSSPGEANFILMNTLLERGDHVICMRPAYQSLYQVVKSLEVELSYWGADPQSWIYDPGDLQDLVQPNTKLIIVNFPHNPTGAFPKMDEWEAIIDIARKQGAYLYADEMYRLLIHKQTEEIPAACDRYEKAISLWGMAKSFGMAGLRIGWLASQDKSVLKKVLSFKDYLSICNSATSEILSIIALRHKEHFLQINLDKIQANIQHFHHFQQNHDDLISFVPPRAGSTAFAQLHLNESSLEFSERLVQETGIMALPAEMFEFGEKHIRVGFGRKNFAEILEVLGSYLSDNY